MMILPGTVVSFDYILTAPDGTVIDRSEAEPLSYLHGAGHIVPGLERQLFGKTVGDHVDALVPAAEGYGESSGQGFRVPLAELPPGMNPQIGMPLGARGPDGQTMTLFIVDIDETSIAVTMDHPLAGVDLHFSVDIRGVRAATEDELSHGHAHGHDGHDHGHGH